MKTEATNIEDLLEILAGLRVAEKIEIAPTDATIMFSIARQVFKGTALTDRQFVLMQEKLESYRDQFLTLDINFDSAINKLRQPLREIDRSKYIKLINQDDTMWIKVRFPFSKSLILSLQSIRCHHLEHKHQKGSHEHLFLFNESNVYNVISAFKNKSFEIDKPLMDLYEQMEKLDALDFVPCVKDMQVKNLHPSGLKLLEEDIGKISPENIVLYKDRSMLYGLDFHDNIDNYLNEYNILSQRIANRSMPAVFIDSKSVSFDDIVRTLYELERFPVVILLEEETAFDALITTHKSLKYNIPEDQISVLMRLDSNKSNGFNEYIKHHKMNNPVDKNTKVVYINKNKINKPLLQSTCSPKTILMLESTRLNTKQQSYADQFDLVIHYDTNISQMLRIGSYSRGIQTL